MSKLLSLLFVVMYVLLIPLVIIPSQGVLADTATVCDQEAEIQEASTSVSESLPSSDSKGHSDVNKPGVDYDNEDTPGIARSSRDSEAEKDLAFNENSYTGNEDSAQNSRPVEDEGCDHESGCFTGQEEDNANNDGDAKHHEESIKDLDCDKPDLGINTTSTTVSNEMKQQSSREEGLETLSTNKDNTSSDQEGLNINSSCLEKTEPHSESGAELKATDNYTVIEKQDDFNLIRDNLSGYFKLISDIKLTGTWNPIGQENGNNLAFSGIFDGQGFTISNLLINNDNMLAGEYAGLFGYTRGATIKNVNLTDVAVSGTVNVGALVGKAYNTTIENCIVNGEVRGSGNNIGGLVGHAAVTRIKRSSVSGIVAGGADRVGGLVGHMTGSNYLGNANIAYSSSDVKVSGANAIGGLVGFTLTQCQISNSYATGIVEGGCCTGGLAGGVSSDTAVTNCYASSQIISVSLPASSTGGLVGNAHSQTTGQNNYWDICSSGLTESALGTGLTKEQMMLASSYKGWDFDQTWHIREGMNSPILQWQLEQENGNGNEQPGQENGEDDHRAPDKLFSSGFIMFAMDYSPFVPLTGEAIVDLIVSKLNEAGLLLEIIRAEETADTEELYYVMVLLQEVQDLLSRHAEQLDEEIFVQLLDWVILMIREVTGLMEAS